jgi:hypothetical protein
MIGFVHRAFIGHQRMEPSALIGYQPKLIGRPLENFFLNTDLGNIFSINRAFCDIDFLWPDETKAVWIAARSSAELAVNSSPSARRTRAVATWRPITGTRSKLA